MKIQGIILIGISILALIYGIYLLTQMPKEIMKRMEEECKETLKRRDQEYEKKQEFYEGLRNWLFR